MINKSEFLKVLNMAKPCLYNQNYLPILKHFYLDSKGVIAYNDVQAISVIWEGLEGIHCAVPGEDLIKVVKSFNTDVINITQTDSEITIQSGKSKVKLQVLSADEFNFNKIKVVDDYIEIKISDTFFEGLEKCMISVGKNPNHPEEMGVTFQSSADGCFLYSTDNSSLSKFNLKELMGDDFNFIMPVFFCDQLIKLKDATNPDKCFLKIYKGGLIAKMRNSESDKKVQLTTKIIYDVKPLNFEKVIKRNANQRDINKTISPITDEFKISVKRAMITNSDTLFTHRSDSLELFTKNQNVEIRDIIEMKSNGTGETSFKVDSKLIYRVMDECTSFSCLDDFLVFTNDYNFLHLIAHCA